jgi:hypothetical protein
MTKPPGAALAGAPSVARGERPIKSERCEHLRDEKWLDEQSLESAPVR